MMNVSAKLMSFGFLVLMATGCSGNNALQAILDSDRVVCVDNVDSDLFNGGDGSAGDPYQVCSAAQFNRVRDHLDKHFIQVNDIDLDATENDEAANWFAPISGTLDKSDIFAGSMMNDPNVIFSGTYDGNDFEIQNWTYSSPTEDGKILLALFPINSGTIKNVNLVNANVSAYSISAAFVAVNTGVILDSSVSGTLAEVTYSGSITANLGGGPVTLPPLFCALAVAEEVGLITNLSVSGTVNMPNTDFVGGGIGFMTDSLAAISDSGIIGTQLTVTGHGTTGGVISYISNGGAGISISNSHITASTVNTVGSSDGIGKRQAGGFAGRMENVSASNLYASDVTVNSTVDAGGLAALVEEGTLALSYVDDVTVNAVEVAGGLLADLKGSAGQCYAINSTITSGATFVSGINGSSAGGLIGVIGEEGVLVSSYTDSVTVSANASAGGVIGVANASDPSAASISQSYAINPTVTVTAFGAVNSLDSGGFIGAVYKDYSTTPDLSASISDSFVIGGTVTGIATASTVYGGVGGFVGNHNGEGVANGKIDRAYVYGTAVSGEYVNVGGFMGFSSGGITNAYAAPASVVSGAGIASMGVASFGTSSGVVTNAYYISGLGASDSTGATVLTDSQMRDQTVSNPMVGIADDTTNFKFGTLSVNPFPQMIYQ